MQLLLDQIRWVHEIPLKQQMPKDGRFQKFCLSLLQNPGDPRSLDDWGQWVGASTRTLSRLFQSELGMSFLLWRQRARVFSALPRLNQGDAIIEIATPGERTYTLSVRRLSLPSAHFTYSALRPPRGIDFPLTRQTLLKKLKNTLELINGFYNTTFKPLINHGTENRHLAYSTSPLALDSLHFRLYDLSCLRHKLKQART